MTRAALCVLFLIGAPLSAASQSLAALAEREKLRRDANAQNGEVAREYTNIGVREPSRKARSEPLAAEETTCGCTSDRPSARPRPTLLEAEENRRAQIWEGKRHSYRLRYQRVSAELHLLRRLEAACQTNAVSFYWTTPWGNEWAAPTWGLGETMCHGVRGAVERARQELQQIETDVWDTARRLRIEPGAARTFHEVRRR